MMGLPLWGVLLFLAMSFGTAKNWAGLAAATLLLINWAILTVAFDISHDQFDWKLNCSVDWATACLVFFAVYNRMAAILVFSYILVIFFGHFQFALSQRELIDQQAYWDKMHYVAWFQAFVVGAFGGCNILRSSRKRVVLACRARRDRLFLQRGGGR